VKLRQHLLLLKVIVILFVIIASAADDSKLYAEPVKSYYLRQTGRVAVYQGKEKHIYNVLMIARVLNGERCRQVGSLRTKEGMDVPDCVDGPEMDARYGPMFRRKPLQAPYVYFKDRVPCLTVFTKEPSAIPETLLRKMVQTLKENGFTEVTVIYPSNPVNPRYIYPMSLSRHMKPPDLILDLQKEPTQ